MDTLQPQPDLDDAAPLYSVVVIGASAGGIIALRTVLERLPATFCLPILIVQHLAPDAVSQLPTVLGWRTGLRVKWAENGEVIAGGTVYVAPADRHLLIEPGGRILLSSANPVEFWRPAVDLLFESAADAYGAGVAAVVLSGLMWDGAKGIAAVARCGGITIAQDEATSAYFEMPSAALDLGHADLMMSASRIAMALDVLSEVVA